MARREDQERLLRKDNGEGSSRIEREKCPRCDSMNTKFCYFNNYSLSQPRHYCKDCKRHWTKGGALRNIPVGGKPRRTKRSRRSPSTTTSQAQIQLPPPPPPPPPSLQQPIMNQQPLSNPGFDIASLFANQANPNPLTPPLNNNVPPIRGFGGYFGHGVTSGFHAMGNANLLAYNNHLHPPVNGLAFQQTLQQQQQQRPPQPQANVSSTAWSTIVHWHGQPPPGAGSNNG